MPVSFSSHRIAPAMLRCLSVAILLGAPSVTLLDAAPALTQKPTKSIWKVFKSDAGGFSLLMPGQPIESQSDGVTSYSVTRAKEAVTYTVSFIDFPVNPTQEKNGITEAFTGIKDGIVEEGGKISQEQTVAIKGFPGKELRVSMPDGALTRVRSYIVGKRLYLVMASTNNEKNLKRSLQGFLDSFRVKPEVIPEAIPEKAPLPKSFTPKPSRPPAATPSTAPTVAPSPAATPSPATDASTEASASLRSASQVFC
ncbi:hypothetical protein IQ266_25625 [filamentous cyanobacterium LEGE 11480]|uniref:Uncharacterized protein n=1 Tax=Romeriopsis navalis LEGE 11480 TaxID=2777977 RepID=A0A928Z6K9_9CYAN|nr:hypothetical protein [Romeriopsis navalis]MBE9033122.1 hypothetical protein [Romeriopsis navalis LEGE 11480]